MNQELIRKAAEAIQKECSPKDGIPFEQLHPDAKQYRMRQAEAALKVFYEHTRSQPREGHGVRCQDCGSAMTPRQGTPCWTCHSCGRTV